MALIDEPLRGELGKQGHLPQPKHAHISLKANYDTGTGKIIFKLEQWMSSAKAAFDLTCEEVDQLFFQSSSFY